jgi:hypothetical protein
MTRSRTPWPFRARHVASACGGGRRCGSAEQGHGLDCDLNPHHSGQGIGFLYTVFPIVVSTLPHGLHQRWCMGFDLKRRNSSQRQFSPRYAADCRLSGANKACDADLRTTTKNTRKAVRTVESVSLRSLMFLCRLRRTSRQCANESLSVLGARAGVTKTSR